jgi:hypothetical protein
VLLHSVGERNEGKGCAGRRSQGEVRGGRVVVMGEQGLRSVKGEKLREKLKIERLREDKGRSGSTVYWIERD